MANANRAAGLIPTKYLNGSKWNGQANIYYIPKADTNAYAVGDPLATAVGSADSNGVSAVTLATAGASHAIRGVLVGLGTNESMMGNPTNPGGILIPAVKQQAYYVMVVDDPNVIFEIQANANGYTAADIGNNCNLLAGTSNGYVSGWQIDDSAASSGFTSSDQLRLLGVTRRLANVLGQKNTAFLVLINQHELKADGGAVRYSLDSNGDPVGFTGPNGNAGWIDAGFFGASPSASAEVNTAAIQAALNKGGQVCLMMPGQYNVIGTQTNSGINVLTDYAMMSIPSDTTLYIGPGVTLLGPQGSASYVKPFFCNSLINSNYLTVATAILATGTYAVVSNTLTVTMANNFAAGQSVLLNFTSGGLASSSSVAYNCQNVTIITASATQFTATLTSANTSGNVSLIANTGNVETSTINDQFFNLTFNTATAHNLTAGSYAKFKYDNSPYNYNKTWQVIAVPSSTSFVVQAINTEIPSPLIPISFTGSISGTTLTISNPTGLIQLGMPITSGAAAGTTITGMNGTGSFTGGGGPGTYQVNISQNTSGTMITSPVVYPANNNITLQIDGVLDNQMNWNFSSSGLISGVSVLFNKVGTLTVNGNFRNAVNAGNFCNIDNFNSLQSKQSNLSTGFKLIGPITTAYIGNLTSSNNQEALLIATQDNGGAAYELIDGNGIVNSGGNISSVILDGFKASNQSLRCIELAIENFTVNEVIVKHAVSTGNLCVFFDSGCLGTAHLGRLVFNDITTEASLIGASLLSLQSSSVTIDEIKIDGYTMTAGNATPAQLEAASPAVLSIALSGNSAILNRLKIANCTVPLYTSSSSYLTIAFKLAGTGSGLIHTLEVENVHFVEVAGGTQPSIGFATNALNNIFRNCEILATNTYTCLVDQTASSSYSIPQTFLYEGITAGSSWSGSTLGSVEGPNLMNVGMNGKTLFITALNINLQQTTNGYCGAVLWMNANSCVVNLTMGNVNMLNFSGNNGFYYIGNDNGNGANYNTYNIRSLGGNINPHTNNFNAVAGVLYNFHDDCSDLHVNITTFVNSSTGWVGKIDGARVYNNTVLGTLASTGVVECLYSNDATPVLQWTRPLNVAGVLTQGIY